MPIDIKLQVTMSIEEESLEDALDEYDELTVGEMIREVLDKGVALESVKVEILEGPNTLEEYDRLRGSA
jgi:hypothetical protein